MAEQAKTKCLSCGARPGEFCIICKQRLTHDEICLTCGDILQDKCYQCETVRDMEGLLNELLAPPEPIPRGGFEGDAIRVGVIPRNNQGRMFNGTHCIHCGERLGPYQRFCLVCGEGKRSPDIPDLHFLNIEDYIRALRGELPNVQTNRAALTNQAHNQLSWMARVFLIK
ncbi:hypothetical protein HCN44_004666 [Aphidius gifuensis]|uniref:Uncharacterized protein n=1 Tax=Aphidius gifuensis TaxID=684658 RepID=A0A835CTL9_APHGI|nr:hypothetical protein HCN44_004666 [Aphidius gifuensis]